jgi:hypothetical protein
MKFSYYTQNVKLSKKKKKDHNSQSFLPLRFACGRQKQVSRRDFIYGRKTFVGDSARKVASKIKNFFLVGFPIQNLDETLAFADYETVVFWPIRVWPLA